MKATVKVSRLAGGRWMAKVIHRGELMSGGIYETQAAAVAGAAGYAAALSHVSEIEVVTTDGADGSAMPAGGAR